MNRTDSTPEGTYGTPHSMGPTHSMEPTHSMGPTQGIRNPPVQSLTDTQLVEHADLAVRRAHSSAVALLDAVAEIDRRALYLGEGYSSMYDYCTRRWRYSSATAARYIAAARAADRFPQVRQMLEQRRLTVCGVARLAGVLTPENYDDLLTRSAGKTFAEVEALAGTRKTAPRVPDRIRIIGASQPASKEEESLSLGIEQVPDGVGSGCSSRVANGVAQAEVIGSASEDESRSRDASTNSPSSTPIVANDRIASTLDVESNIQRGCQSRQVPTESELRYEIRFAAKQKFVEKLERAKSVCSNKADLESILKRALDDLLDRRDPERRSKRRMERSSKRRAVGGTKRRATRGAKLRATGGTIGRAKGGTIRRAKATANGNTRRRSTDDAGESAKQRSTGSSDGSKGPRSRNGASGSASQASTGCVKLHTSGEPNRNRHIPAEVRDSVFLRDGGRCTFVSPTGVRCAARAFLQLDHVVRFADGGLHTVENLRVRCGRHNRNREAPGLGARSRE